MNRDTILVYGAVQPWDGERELLLAYGIAFGFAQLAATPFVTSWTAAGDIIAYDPDFHITSVIIRNSRTHHGRFNVEGLDDRQVLRRSGRLAKYLSCKLMSWSFVTRFPGVFAFSVDSRLPLERVMDIADRSPMPFQIMQRNELVLLRGWAATEEDG